MAGKINEVGVTSSELWVEFGPKNGEMVGNLYTGKGSMSFDANKPIFVMNKEVLADHKNNTQSIVRVIMQALGWAKSKYLGDPSTSGALLKRERALSQIVQHMINVLNNPQQYEKYTKKFHINADDPASIDAFINVETGKGGTNPDAPVTGGTAPSAKPVARPVPTRRESLKAKAKKITKKLQAFLEENGVNPNDPNLQKSTDSALPIQKKKTDILSNTDIVSDVDNTSEDAEDAISADTNTQAIIVFEKFNPITRQNLKGLKEFENIVKTEGGDGFIFISQTETEKPEVLSYEEVVILLKKIIEERNIKSKLIDDQNIENLTDVANYLASEGYKSITICTTSDKLGEYQNELTQKNNKPTESGTFSFEPIEMRKIDTLSDSELKDLNNSAADGDFSTFLKHFGTGEIRFAKKVYLKIRQQMV